MSIVNQEAGGRSPLARLLRWFAPYGKRAVDPDPVVPGTSAGTTAPPILTPLEIEFGGHHLDFFSLRSEDLRHSPNGRHLSVVTTESKILLFDVDVTGDRMRAEFLTAFASADLEAPHGIDWIDDEHVVVANRRAGLAFFRLPRANRWEPETPLEAISKAQPHWFGAPRETRMLGARKIVTGAGSVRKFGDHLYVSSNKANTVTRHRILPGPSCDEGTLVAQGKGINHSRTAPCRRPDGICARGSGRPQPTPGS